MDILLVIFFLAAVAVICNALMLWRHDRDMGRAQRRIKHLETVNAQMVLFLAEAQYHVESWRLAAAISRYGRANVHYAFIGKDSAASNASFDVYRN